MGYAIIFAPQAIERLGEIVRFIAQDNPSAAKKFGTYLIEQTELLADFPELGAPYSKRAGVRRLLRKSYLIFYRIQKERGAIEIMDFWHVARRDPQL